MTQLLTLANELGYAISPIDNWMAYLSHSINMRLKTRGDNFQYQSAAFHIPNFPKLVAQSLFPPHCVMEETDRQQTWTIRTMEELATTLHPILSKTDHMAAGCSRAIKLPSERVVRVVSTVISPMEIAWVQLDKGYDALYLNFNFVMVDEDGEVHAPKDLQRREMALSGMEFIREQVLIDVRALTKADCPLGPGWWRQLGMPERAAEVETMLQNPNGRFKRRKKELPNNVKKYEVDCILDERKSTGRAGMWYLVRWLGYLPEWEPWRINGRPGIDPIETWEPRSVVQNTEALIAWKEAQSSAPVPDQQ